MELAGQYRSLPRPPAHPGLYPFNLFGLHSPLIRSAHFLGYSLFILLNAVVILRPAEVIPALAGFRIYAVLLLACLVFSWRSMLRQLAPGSLVVHPITVCTLGLWAAVALSRFPGSWARAQASLYVFTDLVMYYLLFVGVLNSPARLRQFLLGLIGFTTLATTLVVLHYHGVIHIPAIKIDLSEPTASGEVVPRIGWVAIFRDQNDFALLLVLNMPLCVYFLNSLSFGRCRYLWLIPLAVLGYGLWLTKSRGGFLALTAGLIVLLGSRFGWRSALVLIVCFLPDMFVLYSGRQTEIVGAGTALTRIQIWARAFHLFQQAPLFGVGEGECAHRIGCAVHNSFLHCYTELGLFGGTLFLGAFYFAISGLHDLGSPHLQMIDRRLRRLRPYLLATILAYATGILALSRQRSEPTYMLLGLAAVYWQQAQTSPPWPGLRLDRRHILRVGIAGAALLAVTYLVTVWHH